MILAHEPIDMNPQPAMADVFAAGLSTTSTKRLRELLAESDLAEQRAREMQQRLWALNAESDAAVQTHQSVARPAQNEIAQIDKQIVRAMTAGEPYDPALDSRRLELKGIIEDANEQLRETTEEIEKRRAVVERERGALLAIAGRADFFRTRLCSRDVVSESVWLEHHGHNRFVEIAGRARDEIERTIRNNEALVRSAKERSDISLVRTLEGRIARAQAAASAIGHYSALATKRCDELRKTMINGPE